MNCKDMMQIPELAEVLRLKAGENGLLHSVRWIYFADCLECIKNEYKIENYIHGGEFVVLTNRSVTDDSVKLMELIGQMNDHEIAAIGINEGQISKELAGYCEEKELPLFELPEKYPLIDLSQIICRKLVLEENNKSAAEQLFSSILDAEHLSRDSIMAQAGYLNIDLEGSFFVAEFAFQNIQNSAKNGDSLALGRKVKRMIRTEFMHGIQRDVLVLPQAGSILALVPYFESQEEKNKYIFENIIENARKSCQLDMRIGIGNPKLYLDEIKVSRSEADAALRAARAAGLEGSIFYYKDQGIYTLFSHVDDARVLDEYVEDHLGRLIQADKLSGGNLCETLENYLKCSCSAKRTAEVMFIHRNTLNYRLKKITEILKCDLENLDTCLAFKMAFLIIKYRGL